MKKSFWHLLVRLVEDVDIETVRDEVAALRQKHPASSNDELVEMLTESAARKAAASGAVAGAAGGLIALAALAPDVWNLVRQQSRLVLAISMVWGHPPDPAERAKEVLATMAAATGTAVARRGVRKLAEKAVAEAATRAVFRRLLTRRAASLAPVAGAAVAGAANWMAVRAVGRAANARFRRQSELRTSTPGGE